MHVNCKSGVDILGVGMIYFQNEVVVILLWAVPARAPLLARAPLWEFALGRSQQLLLFGCDCSGYEGSTCSGYEGSTCSGYVGSTVRFESQPQITPTLNPEP